MIYKINAVQAERIYTFIKDIDVTSFQFGADRQMFDKIKIYFNAIVNQSIYINNITGEYPIIEIDYTYLCWIIENIGDGVKNSHNETIKYLNK